MEKKWLKQFEGKKAGSIKEEKDVDVVSGATISCQEIIRKVNALNVQSKK